MDGYSTKKNGNTYRLPLSTFISMGIGKEISSKYQTCLLRVNILRLQIKCQCNGIIRQKTIVVIWWPLMDWMNKHAQILHICTFDLLWSIECSFTWYKAFEFFDIPMNKRREKSTYLSTFRPYASHLIR